MQRPGTHWGWTGSDPSSTVPSGGPPHSLLLQPLPGQSLITLGPRTPRLPAPRHTGARQVTWLWVAWLPAQALLLAWARLCTSLRKHKLKGKLLIISRQCESFWEHSLSLTHEAQSADLLLQTVLSVLSESASVSSLCLGPGNQLAKSAPEITRKLRFHSLSPALRGFSFAHYCLDSSPLALRDCGPGSWFNTAAGTSELRGTKQLLSKNTTIRSWVPAGVKALSARGWKWRG